MSFLLSEFSENSEKRYLSAPFSDKKAKQSMINITEIFVMKIILVIRTRDFISMCFRNNLIFFPLPSLLLTWAIGMCDR